MRRHAFTWALCAAVLTAGSGSAQSTPLATGDWVRLSTRIDRDNPDWIVGELEVITGTYVVLTPIGVGPLAVPHRSLTRFERQLGWRGRTARGGLLGGLIGSVLAGGLFLLTDCGTLCLVSAPTGAGIGMVVGATQVTMRWERIAPDRLKPQVVTRGAEPVLVLRVAF